MADAALNIIQATVPEKTSATEDWIAWYNNLKAYYGKTIANAVMGQTWKYRGGSDSNADVVKLRNATGVPLDNITLIDTVESAGSKVGSMLESLGTGYKIVAITATVLAFGIFFGVAWRLVSAKPEEIGMVVGTAAKAVV